MKIAVTHLHIARGEPSSCRSCPVALAISEATGAAVYVDTDVISIGLRWISTPRHVREWILAYDGNPSGVAAFEFELPDEFARAS